MEVLEKECNGGRRWYREEGVEEGSGGGKRCEGRKWWREKVEERHSTKHPPFPFTTIFVAPLFIVRMFGL